MDIARALLSEATPSRVALAGRGVELALLEWPSAGPLALLHHANGFCKGTWARIAHELSSAYHVVALDARGHGDSSQPEAPAAYGWHEFALDALALAQQLRETHKKPIALGLGHSFGGTSLLGAAARAPGLFERLVLLDPVVPLVAVSPERAEHMAYMVEGARKRRANWSTRDEAREWWAERSLFANWTPEALDLYALDGLRESEAGGVELKCPGAIEAAVFSGGRGVDVAAIAEQVSAPTLWVWAARGNFPRESYQAAAARMPHARVETADASHLIPMEQPGLVVEVVLGGWA